MKNMKILWLTALAVLLALTATSLAEADVAEEEYVVESLEASIELPDAVADNDALFEGFLKQVLPGLAPKANRLMRARPTASVGRARLAQDESLAGTLALYDAILPKIKAVAGGTETSTEFTVTGAELGLEDRYWTAEELGLESLEASGTGIADAILANEGLSLDLYSLLNAILSDLPYDLYWYDKTISPDARSSLGKITENGVTKVRYAGINIKMPVSKDYAFYDEENEKYALYQVSDLPERVNTAVANINRIVEDNAALGDYEKLAAYADTVCGLVSYNDSAAHDSSTPYGDPWQLVYIFDGVEDTMVVCEGYSKGFKYLCDLSDFSGDVDCILITGELAQNGSDLGGHMWNIVSMPDGRYYLVDLTSSDSGSGSNYKLFLKGCTGSDDHYARDDLDYTYDEYTLDTYGIDSPWLSLSHYDYGKDYRIDIGALENGEISCALEAADAGATVALTVAPEIGYVLAEGLSVVRGEEVVPSVAAGGDAWSFVMPYGDVCVTATCEQRFDPDALETWYLPAALTQIDEETFAGSACEAVIVPDGCTSIASGAFADCASLIYALIPEGTSVAEDAFGDSVLIYRR